MQMLPPEPRKSPFADYQSTYSPNNGPGGNHYAPTSCESVYRSMRTFDSQTYSFGSRCLFIFNPDSKDVVELQKPYVQVPKCVQLYEWIFPRKNLTITYKCHETITLKEGGRRDRPI